MEAAGGREGVGARAKNHEGEERPAYGVTAVAFLSVKTFSSSLLRSVSEKPIQRSGLRVRTGAGTATSSNAGEFDISF
jgi:hypothetical protein